MSVAVIRCDAGPGIGGGHVMRSLPLAQALADRGTAITYAVRRGTLEAVPALRRSTFKTVEITGVESSEPYALRGAFPSRIDLLVVDHYGRDAAFEQACRPWVKLIAVIDNVVGRRHDCDVLLDHTPGRQAREWTPYLPGHAKVLCGSQYALLRNSSCVRDTPANHGPVGRIAITFGLSDSKNATELALRAARAALPGVEIDVILGTASPHRVRIEGLARSLGARFHVDPGNYDELVMRADMAIGAGGTSALERACLGLPCIVIALADNQTGMIAALEDAGAIDFAGRLEQLSQDDLAKRIAAMASDADRRHRLSVAARALVDGRGAARVAAILTGLLQSSRQTV